MEGHHQQLILESGRVEELIREDCRVTIDDIPGCLGISHGSAAKARFCKGLCQVGSKTTYRHPQASLFQSLFGASRVYRHR